MDRTSLRWGLLLSGAGAAIGVLSLLIWLVFLPLKGNNDSAIQFVLVLEFRTVVRLVFLAVVVGVAYYGGYRIEREHAATRGTLVRQRRLDAVLAGGLILLTDWVAQTLFMWLTGLNDQRSAFLPFVGSQLVFGVICVLLGAGVAGIGARDQASRRVLARYRETSGAAAGSTSPSAAPALAEGEAAPAE